MQCGMYRITSIILCIYQSIVRLFKFNVMICHLLLIKCDGVNGYGYSV